MTRKIRVLVTDDSVVVRRLITDVLAEDPLIDVVGTASNGKIALTKIPMLEPDLITLDIEMPEMDGLETLRNIRKMRPRLPVIMFSTLTERGASATLDALSLGASDYVTKPSNTGSVAKSMQAIRDELIPKVRGLCGHPPANAPRPSLIRPATPAGGIASSLGPTRSIAPAKPAPITPSVRPDLRPSPRIGGRVDIVVIGVSTGGPNALATVWKELSPNLPVPIVVVQHMPPVFTTLLAERLTRTGTLPMREGVTGAELVAGSAMLAPGDHHLVLERSGGVVRGRLNQDPPHLSCRPAVDPLFLSAVSLFGAGVLAIVLTGMGNDGQLGAEAVRHAGGQVIAQDQATSVVWGMPGAVVNAGLADVVLPLERVAAEINQRAGSDRIRRPSSGPVALSNR